MGVSLVNVLRQKGESEIGVLQLGLFQEPADAHCFLIQFTPDKVVAEAMITITAKEAVAQVLQCIVDIGNLAGADEPQPAGCVDEFNEEWGVFLGNTIDYGSLS